MTTKTFHLPDLGEGLPDATIVEWFVKPGDVARLDEPLVSMETAKAVVEVPSPFSGKVITQHGKAGDIITGAALIEIEIVPACRNVPTPKPAVITARQSRPRQPRTQCGKTDTGRSQERTGAPTRAPWSARWKLAIACMPSRPRMSAASRPCLRCARWRRNSASTWAGSSPAVPMAWYPQGRQGAAEAGSARIGATPAPERPAAASPPPPTGAKIRSERTTLSASGQPMRTTPPTQRVSGQPEQLKGVRRNMARVMAAAHAQVVPTMVSDDADIHAWLPGNDITVRLIRAIVRAAQAVPALNAWFDGENLTRTLHPHVDIGIAVDTDDGLFVPALRNADVLDANGIRQAVNRLRDQVINRSIPADELKGYTISLSNFGVFAGRYATPIVVPPTVAIIAAGKGRHQMTPVMGGFESHKVIPLSLTFDHRAATGGEAARFLKVMLDDLARPA
jgi:pyruvate dehydrogenase E2 component (dihydrolipoamide acetyltransferase)